MFAWLFQLFWTFVDWYRWNFPNNLQRHDPRHDQWYSKYQNLHAREPDLRPFGSFFFKHWMLCCFLYFLFIWGIAETGVDGLEPALIGVFWSPLIALFLTPQKNGTIPLNTYEIWMRMHKNVVYWMNWFLGAVVIQIPLWPLLKEIDKEFAHPLRDGLGKALLLGGQTGLFAVLAFLVLLLTLFHERLLLSKTQKKRR